MATVIWGIVIAGLLIIGKWDKILPLDGWSYMGILAAAFLERGIIRCVTAGETKGSCILFSVIGGSLLLACVTDLAICHVYNFTWIPALAAAAVLLWSGLSTAETAAWAERLSPLLAFFLLQFVVFCRMYGRADCYAFCVCAAAEAARGMKMSGFLFHMLLAYMLLFMVQLVRGNMNRAGNLKKPVPFLPYITVSFWMTIMHQYPSG